MPSLRLACIKLEGTSREGRALMQLGRQPGGGGYYGILTSQLMSLVSTLQFNKNDIVREKKIECSDKLIETPHPKWRMFEYSGAHTCQG